MVLTTRSMQPCVCWTSLVASGRRVRRWPRDHAALPRLHATPEIRIECAEDQKFATVKAVSEVVMAQPNVEVSTVDGVRVTTPDGWWLLRASNTQAVLVARCEGQDEAALGRLVKGLAEILEAQGLVLPSDIMALADRG